MQHLTTIFAMTTVALAMPSFKGKIGTFGSTDHSVTPAMCTDSETSGSTPRGAGFCSTPEAEFDCCYKFSDYPGLDQLQHNLTFIFMPNNFHCDLYMDSRCSGDFTTTSSGENDLSNPEFGNVAFNDKTQSFKCFPA